MDALNYALYETYSGGADKTYDLPDLASDVKGGQAVDKITVLGVVEGSLGSTSTVITAECIGGARITQADPVIAGEMALGDGTVSYTSKVYALSSYWKRYPEKYEHIKPGTVKYFDTVFDAAKAGYADYLNADHDVIIARYVKPIVGSALPVYQTKSWWDANPYALSCNADSEYPVVQFETVWEAQNAGYVNDCQTLLENGDLGGD